LQKVSSDVLLSINSKASKSINNWAASKFSKFSQSSTTFSLTWKWRLDGPQVLPPSGSWQKNGSRPNQFTKERENAPKNIEEVTSDSCFNLRFLLSKWGQRDVQIIEEDGCNICLAQRRLLKNKQDTQFYHSARDFLFIWLSHIGSIFTKIHIVYIYSSHIEYSHIQYTYLQLTTRENMYTCIPVGWAVCKIRNLRVVILSWRAFSRNQYSWLSKRERERRQEKGLSWASA
jgi:hypothetical protein